MLLLFATLFFGLGWLHEVSAQSPLGDVARKEEARRKETTSGKTYTNVNPGEVGQPTAPKAPQVEGAPAAGAAAGTPATGASGTGATAAAASSPTVPPATPDPIKEAELAKAKREEEARLEQQKQEAEALRRRVADLRTRLDAAFQNLGPDPASKNSASSTIGRPKDGPKDEVDTAIDSLRHQLALAMEALKVVEQNPQAAKIPVDGIIK